MARAIWSGAIGFGLVNVPVQLLPATEDKTVHFHELEAKSGKRIHHRRVAQGSDREVDLGDIVKGYEVSKGNYVRLEPDELDSVQPERSRTITVEDFVDIGEIDPLYFRRGYYVVPAEAGKHAYQLLLTAMTDANLVAIARFVMRTKEYLAAIRADHGALVLETMYFADEIRDVGQLDLPKPSSLPKKELDMARQLIDSLATDWHPEQYRDTHREAVLELIERKAKGEEIVTEAAEEPAPVTDLMAALRDSVREARGGKPERGRQGKSRKRSTGEAKLAHLTRDELYDRAAEAGIGGRSKMSKDDLIDALQQAS